MKKKKLLGRRRFYILLFFSFPSSSWSVNINVQVFVLRSVRECWRRRRNFSLSSTSALLCYYIVFARRRRCVLLFDIYLYYCFVCYFSLFILVHVICGHITEESFLTLYIHAGSCCLHRHITMAPMFIFLGRVSVRNLILQENNIRIRRNSFYSVDPSSN